MDNHGIAGKYAAAKPPDIRLCHFGHSVDLNAPGVILDAIMGKDDPDAKAFCQTCDRYYSVKHMRLPTS